MARTSQTKGTKSTRQSVTSKKKKTAKHPVLDNRVYPTTEEIAKLYKIPARRVRWLKKFAADLMAKDETPAS